MWGAPFAELRKSFSSMSMSASSSETKGGVAMSSRLTPKSKVLFWPLPQHPFYNFGVED